MMTNFDDLTPYEQSMRTGRHGDEAERAMFLNRPSVMLGLEPIKDGNQWSVLYGPNIQEGVCGYGDTPDKAMADFDKNWKEQTLKPVSNKEEIDEKVS